MKKFISINEWDSTNQEKPKKNKEQKTYGCVMLDANDISDWKEKHTDGIDPKDVYTKPYDDSYGLEDNPHVTVLYGIHEDEIDPEIIMDLIQNDIEALTVTVDEISYFEGEEYDVVKYDVPVSDQLQQYRDKFENNFSNTQTYPDYHPHMTLAYVNPGEGKKYAKKLEEPFELTFRKGVYSFHDEEGEQIRKEHVIPVNE